MIEIIQNIIDLLTYTPTLYVDGMMGEVQGAWISALIGVAGSLIGAGISASGSSSNAKQLKKAAQKNYNMLMENAEMSKMTLNEQMDLYKEDMDSYRSSMIQRYGLAGGIRADDAQLEEVRNYNFGVDEIDTDTYEQGLKATAQKKIDKKTTKAKNMAAALYGGRRSDEQGDEGPDYAAQKAFVKQQNEKYTDKYMGEVDKKVTAYLGDQLGNYQGRQTNWQGTAESSAILNLRTSTTNMQRDINNAYKAGMIDYWQQRKNAQNVKDTLQTQAIGYSTQARTTLASGFTSAIQYGAQAYTQYRSGGTGTSYTSGGGVAQHQFG